MRRAGAFVYPWDVVDDPDAPRRLAELGVRHVALAAAYHSTRALTPRHPRHRIVTARHSAVLYPPDPERWSRRALRPSTHGWAEAGEDPYGTAARALAGAGLEVHSWVVLVHNSRLGTDFPDITVRNAHGDRYPWAPCAARPEVREYAVTLAAEAAAREHTSGTELESCGWYGLAHLHGHDKIHGVPLDGAGRYLMSLCFCGVCRAGYAELGADPEALRAAVVRALEPLWRAAAPASAPARGRAAEEARVRELLGAEPAEVFAAWRARAARRLRREAVAAVREAAGDTTGDGASFPVLLHADPAPHRTGADTGVDPAEARADADGVVLPCPGGASGADERAAVLAPFGSPVPDAGAPARPERRPFTVAANFSVVSGMGGSPRTLAADAAHARALGADELRLYHAGLASDADLAAVRDALTAEHA